MTTDYEKWMSHALTLAKEAQRLDEVPVGAVLVLNEEIVGEGFNHTIGLNDPTAHAEIRALRDAAARIGNYRVPGSTLYVTIEPCAMCAGALVHARVKEVVFGCPEPKAGAVVSRLRLLDANHFNHAVAYRGGVLEDECRSLISGFFRSKRTGRGRTG